jgi:hypothetical protein
LFPLHDVDNYFIFHLELWQGQSKIRNARKSLSFGKGQRAKGVVNKGPTTKSTLNQPNAMEAQVKPTTLVLGDFSAHGFDPRFFYGVGF